MQWKEILNSIKSSTIALVVLLIAITIATQAATVLYSGSFSVVTGGTYTDAAQTASTCADFNGSKQLGSNANCVTGLTAGTNISLGGTATNPTISVVGSPAYSGGASFANGVGVDANTAPTNGFKCGVANTTSCKFLAATGTTTTSGFAFNTTTVCHATTDLAVVFQINSVTQANLQCGGLFSSNGLVATANITSTGAIVAGNATAPTTASGDLGASRSASTGAVQIGGGTSQATLDWNVNNALALTSSVPIFSATSSGGLTGPVPPTYTVSNTAAPRTEHCVEGVEAGSTGNSILSWNAAQAFASAGAYSLFAIDETNGNIMTQAISFTTTSFTYNAPATVAGHNYYFRVCGA